MRRRQTIMARVRPAVRITEQTDGHIFPHAIIYFLFLQVSRLNPNMRWEEIARIARADSVYFQRLQDEYFELRRRATTALKALWSTIHTRISAAIRCGTRRAEKGRQGGNQRVRGIVDTTPAIGRSNTGVVALVLHA